MDKITSTPIPEQGQSNRPVRSAFVAEPFVQLREDPSIQLYMRYPQLGMQNAEEDCYVRLEVAHMLRQAAGKLPRGYKLRIWDAWRPFALQQELFTTYRTQIVEQFGLQDLPKDEAEAFISQYVAVPVDNRDMPPAHTTGGAVDLTIVGPHGCELPMGTEFDAFTRRTETRWFEYPEANAHVADDSKPEQNAAEVRDNRRLLYHAMCSVGFVNLPSEWWHFSYGDANWARATGEPMRYRGCFGREELDMQGDEH